MTANNSESAPDEGRRNLVVCLDGTTNEPEAGTTNVARMFDVVIKDKRQLVYYDPGVGTLGARAAITPWGKALTRLAGMAIGYGIKDDIVEAYTWLMRNYHRNDRIYVFGFSRGAYTARALTGMLRTVGLLHADADNMLPYALKLYAKSGGTVPDPGARLDPGDASDEQAQDEDAGEAAVTSAHPDTDDEAVEHAEGAAVTSAKQAEKNFWKLRNDFRRRFGNREFPNPFDTSRHQVHFVGVWDTVKSVGWLNVKARVEIARWPFTANLANVGTARHALAIDERRRPFAEYRFKEEAVAGSGGRFEELWFAGVHGDVGGQNRDDNRLPDIAFSWMVKEAEANGLRINKRRYRQLVDAGFDEALPAERALGVIQPNAGIWRWARGWRVRKLRSGDRIHPSVVHRYGHPEQLREPYTPKNVPIEYFASQN